MIFVKWILWFLRQIEEIVSFESEIYCNRSNLSKSILLYAKTIGYSNKRIAQISGISEENVVEMLKVF